MAPPWSPPPRATPRVGGLRVPSGVSEPPRDFHEARGAGGKPRQGWDLGPRGAERGRAEEETRRGWEKEGGADVGREGRLPGLARGDTGPTRGVAGRAGSLRGRGRREAVGAARGCRRRDSARRQPHGQGARAGRGTPGQRSARHVARAPGRRQRPAEERRGAREPAAAAGRGREAQGGPWGAGTGAPRGARRWVLEFRGGDCGGAEVAVRPETRRGGGVGMLGGGGDPGTLASAQCPRRLEWLLSQLLRPLGEEARGRRRLAWPGMAGAPRHVGSALP